MLHSLFYFGVLLPTLIIILCFIIFLICWFKCRLREKFTKKPKFKGGSHNSTQTSIVSATSNCPPSRDYWEIDKTLQGTKMNRSETQQTSLCTNSKFVPGDFSTKRDDDEWRYMSRNSVELYRREQVWTTKCDSDSSFDDEHWQERDSGIQVRGARTNYAMLEDETAITKTGQNDKTLTFISKNGYHLPNGGVHHAQITPHRADCYSSHDDLSPLSDDETFDDRPPRPDDDRSSSQLHFVSGNYRTNLNGYTHLVPVATSLYRNDDRPHFHQEHNTTTTERARNLRLDANELVSKSNMAAPVTAHAQSQTRYQCSPYAVTDIRAPVIRV